VPDKRIYAQIVPIILRKAARHKRRLIKPTFPQSPTMEWHWDQKGIGRILDKPANPLCKDFCQAHFPTIFKLQNSLPRDSAICDSSANTIMERRMLQAGPACQIDTDDWKTARVATTIIQEIDCRPTG
jgi:hypothetical protein